MSRAKFIVDLINQNEKAVVEDNLLFDERQFDLLQNNDLCESAPPSASIVTPMRDPSTINPTYSAPLMAEPSCDIFPVDNVITEENMSYKPLLERVKTPRCQESPFSEVSGIEELSSSPVRVFSDSSVSWLPDSEEERIIKKKKIVYVATSSSEIDSDEGTPTGIKTKFITIDDQPKAAALPSCDLNFADNDTVSTQTSSEPVSVAATSDINVEGLRWKKSDPSKWKKNIAKTNRHKGLPYLNIQGKNMPAKQPRPVKCNIKCRYQCHINFSDDDRRRICLMYWKLNDYIAQKQFLLYNVNAKPLKTMKVGIPSNKNRTVAYEYYFEKNDDKVRVCKDFFLKTLCISNGPVIEAFKHRDELGIYTGKDARGARDPINKTSLEMEQKVIDHINSFPRLESHYCRKKSKRQYLDSKLSIAKMYELFKEKFTANEKPCSMYVYKKIFGTKFNLSFFTPKKDLCITCTRYESAGRPEHLKEEYDLHIRRKNDAQQAKESDKQKSIIDDTYLVVTADMQSTLHIPVSGIGILYYTRKLNVQNYTIYTAKSPNEAFCITWNEINGKRGSVEIASAIDWWITQIPNKIKEVTIYSDTCAGQNRNQFITAYLAHLIQRSDVHLQVIEQKYLESGHTHMEVDSMHSAIEKEQRHAPVYSMIDWKLIMERARSKRNRNSAPPYIVKELNYTDMLDVRALNEKMVKNTAKDKEGNKIKWLKIKCLRFERKYPGLVKFRYEHTGPYLEFNLLEIQNNSNLITRKRKRQEEQPHNTIPTTEELIQELKNYKIPPAYSSALPISEAKKKDLVNLCTKGIIPQELHLWYQSLPTSKDVIDRLVEPDVTEDVEEEA